MTTTRRQLAIAVLIAITAGCAGGSGDGDTTSVQIDDQVVIDPDVVAAARERQQNEAELQELTVATDPADDQQQPDNSDASTDTDADPDTDTAAEFEPESGDEQTAETTAPEIEVAEAEEDELDGLLNSLTTFNNCLSDDGFEFMGAPGIGGATGDQFEQDYLASLGKCATSSNILDAFDSYGSAQESRTPEEIAAYNYGLPVFRDCMIALGWNIGELVPDASGALGFGGTLEPPSGADGFGTDDIADCRLEAEQYVADNYDGDI